MHTILYNQKNMDLAYRVPRNLFNQIQAANDKFTEFKARASVDATYLEHQASRNFNDEIQHLRDAIVYYDQITEQIENVSIRCYNEIQSLIREEKQDSKNGDTPIANFEQICTNMYKIDSRIKSIRPLVLDAPNMILRTAVIDNEQSRYNDNYGRREMFTDDKIRNQQQRTFFYQIFDLVFYHFEQQLHLEFVKAIKTFIDKKIDEYDNPPSLVDSVMYTAVSAYDLFREATGKFQDYKQQQQQQQDKPEPAVPVLNKQSKQVVSEFISRADPAGPALAAQINEDVVAMQILYGPGFNLTSTTFTMHPGDISIESKDENTTIVSTVTKDGELKGLGIRVLKNRFIGAVETLKTCFVKPLKEDEQAVIVTAYLPRSTNAPVFSRHLRTATWLALVLSGHYMTIADAPYDAEPNFDDGNHLSFLENAPDYLLSYGVSSARPDLPFPEPEPVIPTPIISNSSTSQDTTDLSQLVQFRYENPPSAINNNTLVRTPRVPKINQQQVMNTSNFTFNELRGLYEARSPRFNYYREFSDIRTEESKGVTLYEFAKSGNYNESTIEWTDVNYYGAIFPMLYDRAHFLFFQLRICTVNELPLTDEEILKKWGDRDKKITEEKQQQQQRRRPSPNTIHMLSTLKGYASILTTWGEKHPQTGQFVELEWEEMAKRGLRFMGHTSAAYAAARLSTKSTSTINNAAAAGLIYTVTSLAPELLPVDTTTYFDALMHTSSVDKISKKIIDKYEDTSSKHQHVGLKPINDTIQQEQHANDLLTFKDKQQQHQSKKSKSKTTTTKQSDIDTMNLVDVLESIFQYCIDRSEPLDRFDELRYAAESLSL